MPEFNRNRLQPTSYQFSIHRLPEFSFFVQASNVPGCTLGSTNQPTRFRTLPREGDNITYDDLNVEFMVNEDMGNYIEVFNWIHAIGFPHKHSEYKALTNARDGSGEGVYSDATMSIVSSSNNPLVRIEFEDVFPVELSSFEMDSRIENSPPILVTARFQFKDYRFTPL